MKSLSVNPLRINLQLNACKEMDLVISKGQEEGGERWGQREQDLAAVAQELCRSQSRNPGRCCRGQLWKDGRAVQKPGLQVWEVSLEVTWRREENAMQQELPQRAWEQPSRQKGWGSPPSTAKGKGQNFRGQSCVMLNSQLGPQESLHFRRESALCLWFS